MTWRCPLLIATGLLLCGCAETASGPHQASSAAPVESSAAQPAASAGPLAKLGPSHGWIVGADPTKLAGDPSQEAQIAITQAREHPASADEVQHSETADLNHDGFVTLDEIVEMKRAGLSDQKIIDRIHRTKYVFDLNDRQRQYLLDRGVDQTVIDAMASMGAQIAGGSGASS